MKKLVIVAPRMTWHYRAWLDSQTKAEDDVRRKFLGEWPDDSDDWTNEKPSHKTARADFST